MEGIDRLRERVNELLKRHTALIRENENLYKEQERLHAELARLKSTSQESDLALLSKKIGEAFPDEASRAKNRNLIDEVIREIDQILTKLHD